MSNSSTSLQITYLPTSRFFPIDPAELQPVLSKSYIEIAQAVNRRTVGAFNTFQVVTGDLYYSLVNNDIHKPIQFRQSYRQLFILGPVSAGASVSIPFDMSQITETVRIYGNCITNSPTSKFRPIPYVSTTNVNAQIQIDLNTSTTPNIIVVSNGAGAPNILSGTIVIEYLLN